MLADGLVAHGSELAFCVPGESYLALLDGLYEHRGAFRIVNCRHEGAAANAADAYGKLTGRPGLCFVTRGPGATHAAAGIHTAQQDSTPLLMLVGQVAREERGRESFQELDYEAVFGPMAKWAFEIDDPERIPEVLARAYTVATSGRPGPVVLSLPEDVLSAEVAAETRRATGRCGPRLRRRRSRSWARCSRRPSARSCSSAAARGTTRRRRPSRAGRSPAGCRWARPSAARTSSTTRARATPATSASASTRRSRSGSATATCCSRSAPG